MSWLKKNARISMQYWPTSPEISLSYALVFEDQLVPASGAVGAAETDYSENFDMVEIRRCEGVATRSENP